ncbi:MAG: hypothetical protein AAFU38_14010, partial [Bacteroidota bacterium]
EAWLYTDRQYGSVRPTPVLRSPSFITGFEVLRIEHDAQYTYREWGWDADLVLADKSTRTKRVLVDAEGEIETALAPWLDDVETLGPPQDHDSALVNSPHLGRPEEYPHLWK